MSPKPRGRSKRRAWIKRRIVILRAQIRRGFLEAWYQGEHWTVTAQERGCRAAIKALTLELESSLE